MIEVLNKIAWPLVVLTVSIIFLFVFRPPLAALIGRLKSARFGKDKILDFGEAQVDNRDRLQTLEKRANHFTNPETGEVTWSNSANLFWLGHDLMWTMQMALRGAPLKAILHGLNQSQHHMTHLNMNNTAGGIRLAKLIADANRSHDSDWDTHKRDVFATELDIALDEVGFLAESSQPGYQGGKTWPTAADRLAARR
jgi:hypothetical protein